jgi:hypothetical protein
MCFMRKLSLAKPTGALRSCGHNERASWQDQPRMLPACDLGPSVSRIIPQRIRGIQSVPAKVCLWDTPGSIMKNIDPLFSFGHGLSYTTFKYANLHVDKDSDVGVTVRVQIENTGNREGDEVPQVYLWRPE